MKSAPGKNHREGITLLDLAKKFPNETAAREWFEEILWPNGVRRCPSCNGTSSYECAHAKMPYRCRDCGKYFSVKTATVMAGSPIPLLKWLYAIYLDVTSLKGVSSMKLHRDLGITQKTAWFMQQRIREAFAQKRGGRLFGGPVEVDEAYFGGRKHNMSNTKRKLARGRGPTDKAAVVGVKDRTSNEVAAEVVKRTDAATLHGFVAKHVDTSATVFTDDASTYRSLPNRHYSVRHSASEYVRGEVHTNGVESFWSMLKRAHKGTFHKFSSKHLQRYINEFAGRHNIRDFDTPQQMAILAKGLGGKVLSYKMLIADNGLDSGART